jgi:hypothetical protein
MPVSLVLSDAPNLAFYQGYLLHNCDVSKLPVLR